jgi:hypothetical protein
VEAGNDRLARDGCPFVVVVGHANFYPRFGFRPASIYGITCEWEVPDEAFMVLTLDHSKMNDVSGLAQYRPEFSTHFIGARFPRDRCYGRLGRVANERQCAKPLYSRSGGTCGHAGL